MSARIVLREDDAGPSVQTILVRRRGLSGISIAYWNRCRRYVEDARTDAAEGVHHNSAVPYLSPTFRTMRHSHSPVRFLLLLAGVAVLPVAVLAQNAGIGYRIDGLDLVVFDQLIKASTSPETQYPELDLSFRLETDTLAVEAARDLHSINAARVAAISGIALGVGFGAMEIHRRVWWEDRRPQFHFHDNWAYSRWADKFGHYFSSSFLTRYYATSLDWAGLSPSQAQAWGAGMAWTSMLYYELLDGFGPTWGFSSGDLFFNTLGVGLTFAQWQLSELKPYTLKVSYWPSGEDEIITADYTGLTWWVTANLQTALPHGAGQIFPDWLNLAVGYAARNPDEAGFLKTSYAYVGVDLELAALPINHPIWSRAISWFRYFHIPAPAIRLTPNPAFVLLAH